MTEWLDNDALFRREIAEGARWEGWLAQRWTEMGLPVTTTPLSVRPSVEERAAYSDSGDLMVGRFKVEVKSRSLKFSAPFDFPFSTVLVCAANRLGEWEKNRPTAIAVISRPRLSVVVIPFSTRARWTQGRQIDGVRGIEYDAVYCRRVDLRSEEEFVTWVRAHG